MTSIDYFFDETSYLEQVIATYKIVISTLVLIFNRHKNNIISKWDGDKSAQHTYLCMYESYTNNNLILQLN